MASAEWFYLEGNASIGPFPWQRLLDLLHSGIIDPNTPVWRDGTTDRILLADAMKLTHSEQTGTPAPQMPNFLSDAAVNQSSIDALPITGSDVPTAGSGIRPFTDNVTDARGWSTRPVAPWRRYGARVLDTTIHGVAGMFVLGFVWYSVAPVSADAFFAVFEGPGGRALDIIMTSFVAALVGGFVVGASGSSIGKAIFGIKVVDANLHAIGIVKGVGREFQVWLIGISLGIPIIALFTLIAAYRRLKRDGVTLWDRERYVVLQRPSGPLQNLLNIFGILLCIVAAVFVRYLASL